MNLSEKQIFGSRLKLARKMAGMSLQVLSDSLNGIVSKQSLNKYELGIMMPSQNILLGIANVLKLKPDYFFRKNILELNDVAFRKNSNLQKGIQDSIIEKARDYVDRYSEIENLLGLNPDFNNPVSDVRINNKLDVEIAVNKMRENWELGNNPIPDIGKMLELRAVKVFFCEINDNFDGASFLASNNIPVLAINTKNKTIDRIRFTIVHELAHIVLKFAPPLLEDEKAIEKLCNHFASCFLLPSAKLLEMIGGNSRTYIHIKEFISIKEYYGISIKAVVFRLKEMAVISDNYYNRWMIYLSKSYGRNNEPGNYNNEEIVSLMEQLVNRALSEGIISMSKAAFLLNTDINEMRKGDCSV